MQWGVAFCRWVRYNDPRMARQALGKGLHALIQQTGGGTSSTLSVDEQRRVITAQVSEIRLSPFQPRRIIKETQIKELADSIRERGLIQPLVVRRVDGNFELIAGERRLRAIKMLGRDVVKVVVMDATDQEVAELTLIENLQREDLSPLEEAEQYRLLQTRFNLKQEEIAQHVGKSRAMIANMVRLLDLTPEVRTMLDGGQISVGHAKVLLQLKDAQTQVQAATRVVRSGLTVRRTERLVHDILNPPEPEPSPSTVLSSTERAVCQQLSSKLGTGVSISPKGGNGGVIEIPYSNTTELSRMMEIFGFSVESE